jgi:hypothetical protein
LKELLVVKRQKRIATAQRRTYHSLHSPLSCRAPPSTLDNKSHPVRDGGNNDEHKGSETSVDYSRDEAPQQSRLRKREPRSQYRMLRASTMEEVGARYQYNCTRAPGMAAKAMPSCHYRTLPHTGTFSWSGIFIWWQPHVWQCTRVPWHC